MADTIFDIARRFQDKIENDVGYATRFQTKTRENFLANDAVASEMTANDLATLQNQFGIQDLSNTYNTRLQNSRLAQQNALLENQRAIDTFGSRAASEDLQNSLDDQKTQFELDNFGKKSALELARLEGDALEAETRLVKLTHDREYATLENAVQGIEGADKYRELFKLAKAGGKTPKPAILARIKKSMAVDIDDDIEGFEYLNEFLSYSGVGKLSSAQNIKRNAALQKFKNSYKSSDKELLRLAIDKKVIDETNIPPLILEMLTSGADTFEEFGASLEDPVVEDLATEDIQPDDPIDGNVDTFADVGPFVDPNAAPEPEQSAPVTAPEIEEVVTKAVEAAIAKVNGTFNTDDADLSDTPTVNSFENEYDPTYKELQAEVDTILKTPATILKSRIGEVQLLLDDLDPRIDTDRIKQLLMILNKLERSFRFNIPVDELQPNG